MYEGGRPGRTGTGRGGSVGTQRKENHKKRRRKELGSSETQEKIILLTLRNTIEVPGKKA